MPLAACSFEHRIPLRGRDAVAALADIASGLAHLHAQNVLHRDLAPRNVLVFDDGRWALTDLGLSREVQVEDGEVAAARVLSVEQFPVRFAAPELLNRALREYFPASDVWMLALTMWQATSDSLPFAGFADGLAAARAAANILTNRSEQRSTGRRSPVLFQTQ
jgi:serine/threonine protein kinase